MFRTLSVPLVVASLLGCQAHSSVAAPSGSFGQATASVGAASSNESGQKTRTVRIATFNLENFGPSKAKNHDSMKAYVEAIRRYDLVATQEIQNETGDAALELLRAINEGDGPDYEMLLSGSSGRTADDPASQERYAYFYNKDVIRALEGAQLYEDSSSAFSRTPFVGRFAAGDWDFTLVEVHTQPNAAVAEIGALHQVVAWARATYKDEDVIALGDFNGACGHATPADLDTLSLRKAGYTWIVPDDADTNTSAKVCAYDRIVVTSAAGKQYAGRWGVDHETRDVSDHYPVWAEFSVAAR